MSADAAARRATYLSGLSPQTGKPGSPFVRFEHCSALVFMVWVVAPPHDVDAVNAAMNAPGARALGPPCAS